MGRWSRRLVPLLIEFGGIADGDPVLEVPDQVNAMIEAFLRHYL